MSYPVDRHVMYRRSAIRCIDDVILVFCVRAANDRVQRSLNMVSCPIRRDLEHLLVIYLRKYQWRLWRLRKVEVIHEITGLGQCIALPQVGEVVIFLGKLYERTELTLYT